jgi:hypothetical protein
VQGRETLGPSLRVALSELICHTGVRLHQVLVIVEHQEKTAVAQRRQQAAFRCNLNCSGASSRGRRHLCEQARGADPKHANQLLRLALAPHEREVRAWPELEQSSPA